MKITDKDRKIISSLLKMSSETFSMNCCNDIQDDIQGLFNQQERDEFNKKLADYNNSPDDYEPGEEYIYGGDWFLMEYYADMILQNGGKIMDVTKEDMRKVVEIITEIIGGRASGGKILELEEKFCPPPTITSKEAKEAARSNWLQETTTNTPFTYYNGVYWTWNGLVLIEGEKKEGCYPLEYRIVAPQRTGTKLVPFSRIKDLRYTGKARSWFREYDFTNGEFNPVEHSLHYTEINCEWIIETILPPEIK